MFAMCMLSLVAELIIACFRISRGKEAKDAVPKAAKIADKVHHFSEGSNINPYGFDTNSINKLEKDYDHRGGLEIAILNADCVNASFYMNPEGCRDSTIQSSPF
ncbi:hypothetical protein GGS21DRAFT_531429 [Xylaria nigripes]|nr:hypothetical protein GGS21DRAFT_531429 [Xylaria nigripes]